MTYAFISGATGGVGKAFIERCAARGENLFLTGRNEKSLSNLRGSILNEHPQLKVDFFACELSSKAGRAKMYEYIESKDLFFHRLCNVAGVDIQKAFCKYTEDKIISQVRVNIEATMSLTSFIINRRAKHLKIVTISSMSAMCPMPYFAIYSATKTALNSFFLSLRLELKKDNVKITVVAPGGIPTRPDIIADIKGQGIWGRLSAKSADYVAEKSLRAVEKNKAFLIPGFFNNVLSCVSKIVPRCIKMRFIANRWKKIEKDAF